MSKPPSRIVAVPIALSILVAVLWAFPRVWYTSSGNGTMRWLRERVEMPGWSFQPVPVGESAEKVLVADKTVNGSYTNQAGGAVRVFFAKRFEEKANEIGLFIHTPDRCWVETGWTISRDALPTFREVEIQGIRVPVERRIFEVNGYRELVYFFGLQGGRPLPYRLDHYLSTGLRAHHGKRGLDLIRISDGHFWSRLWESFTTRRQFLGPKQFVRVSTPVKGVDPHEADAQLEKFLSEWLAPSDYLQEKSEWQLASAAQNTKKAEQSE